MLQTVDVRELSVSAYRSVAPDQIIGGLPEIAKRLRGARVPRLSATPHGGGVSEVVRSVASLYNDLGVHTMWKIISGVPPFFAVTKKMHNALQGAAKPLASADRVPYEQTAELNAAELTAAKRLCARVVKEVR
jgi:trehalose synthase